jgi:hypothetical protein
VVHTYPKGTLLFFARSINNSEFVPQGPTPFDVTIYLVDHSIEERSTIAHALVANYAYAHGIEAKTYKSHQPRVEYAHVNLTSQQIDNSLLKIKANLTDHTFSPSLSVLIDSGAKRDFVSAETIHKLELVTKRLDKTLRVSLANSKTTVIANQYATLSITLLSGFVITKNFVVLNTSDSLANIIIGLPWLKDENSDINWTTANALNRQTNSIIFSSAITTPRPTLVEITTAYKMKHIIEQNDTYTAFFFATVIQISDDASLAAAKVTSEIPHNLLGRSADDEFHIKNDTGPAYDAISHTLLNQCNHTDTIFNGLPPLPWCL